MQKPEEKKKDRREEIESTHDLFPCYFYSRQISLALNQEFDN